MPSLTHRSLTVELLDPDRHRSRLGHRYCWGGYIWQVHDAQAGPLLTGTEWPEAEPDPYNGQGLPESFRHRETTGAPLLWRGEAGLAPGAGVLALRDGVTHVTEPCIWHQELDERRAVFRTRQAALGWTYELERTVSLEGRTVRSATRYTNRGDIPLVHLWFAHPFFALGRDGRATITLPAGTSLAENPGYALTGNQLHFRRAFQGKNDGHLDTLHLPPGVPLIATLSHPRLTGVTFSTDFAPQRTIIWANGNTVSVEPYLALDLAPGQSRTWELTYVFGEPI